MQRIEMFDTVLVEESLIYVTINTSYMCMPKLQLTYHLQTAKNKDPVGRTNKPPVFIENDTLECISSCLNWESEPNYFTRNPLFRIECLHVYIVTALRD